MADLRTVPMNPDDDELIIDAPLDQWEASLPLGIWEAVITDKPVATRSKAKNQLQLAIPLELGVNNGVRKTKYYLQLEGNGLKHTHKQLDELGITYDYQNGALRFKSLKAFMGLKCKAEVKENVWNGIKTNKINFLYKPDNAPIEG